MTAPRIETHLAPLNAMLATVCRKLGRDRMRVIMSDSHGLCVVTEQATVQTCHRLHGDFVAMMTEILRRLTEANR